MKAKLTEWFPAKVRPVRKGLYLRSWACGPAYAYWNGKSWGQSYTFSYITEEEAKRLALADRNTASKFERPWRGLAQKP